MISEAGEREAKAIAKRYGVAMKKLAGKSRDWQAEMARTEIAWVLKTHHGSKQSDIAKLLNRTGPAIKLMQRRYDVMAAAFQERADEQHQVFLQSDEALHIRDELLKANGEIDDLKRKLAWADGRRGDGVRRADGFTEAETEILRIITARESGRIAHEQHASLWRHMSNIRAKLRKLGLDGTVKVETLIGEGYRLTHGRAVLADLLMGGHVPAVALPPPAQAHLFLAA